ncbi:MAG: hypothetical protein ACP5QR_14470 [Rhizomicrobium sp.]
MFTDTMRRWVNGVRDTQSQYAVTRLLYPLFDRASSLPLTSAGLLISAAGSTLAKTGTSNFYALANGVLQNVAASTNMPALSGTVANAMFNVFCFFIDAGGNVTSQMGNEGASLAGVTFPQFPEGKAIVGFIIINPTGTGNFVGGTTALDNSTVVPNAAYVSPIGGFDPYALTGLAATP